VLYECLTGRLPFTGDGWLAVAMQHVRDPLPDPRAVAPDVPAHLAEAALRAAAKDPDRRFQRAEDFAAALDGAPFDGATARFPVPPAEAAGGDGGPPTATTVPTAATVAGVARVRRRRRRPLAWGAAVVCLGAVAAGAWLLGALPGIDAPGAGERAVPLHIAAAVSYDPEGDGTESAPEVAFAHDGDPGTAWHTERYATAGFGNLKKGVGLQLTLAAPARPSEVEVVSPSAGGTFELLGPLHGGMGPRDVLGRGAFDGGTVRVALDRPAEAGTDYVLWITSLPADGGGFRAAVAEVSLQGAANR
jgi:eukaryotic-like serine/threonine-protein kinase